MAFLKEALRQNKLTIGSWITLGHTSIAEIMAKAGFDWLTIDMEHSAIDLRDAQNLIKVIELSGCTPLVRVGENNPYLIKRVMDAGAHGVIVPMVNSREEAIKAVEAVKYPPHGKRGVGLARAQGYGLGFEQYKNWLVNESIVIVQIEHIKAVENLEEILKVEGVDSFIVGPYDLSGSLGIPGQFEDQRVKEALEKVTATAKKLNKTAGFHVVPPDADALKQKINEGYRFLGFSLDTLFLGTNCKKLLESLNNLRIR
ncbi:MAG: 2,4-dihydroxyhept-2-ene-1,7-dioic acid aldolase [Candidatus Nealsonbacteria bacterium]|nr:2,4-dihydroxyhept-2-ene-1,7-dioic acid aldolase [Candidatus Nealsonbacteria bacterium]